MPAMVGTYDVWLVVLSAVVASTASYVALDLASRVTAWQGSRASRYWLAGGAVSMGMGIWSMHFIGMLAFRLPIPMSYDIPITLLSLLIAIVVSGFALHTASRGALTTRRLLVAGLLMGVGIAAMHYTGMAAMQMRPPIHYDALLFAVSVLIAMAAAVAALWIAFQLRSETILSAFWKKAGSALVMGAAISGMHYTGMAAAIFAPDSVCTVSPQDINNFWLAAAIGGFSFVFLATTLLVSVLDARLADRSAKLAGTLRLSNEALRESEERYRRLTNLSSDMYWEQDDQYRFVAFSGSGPDGIVRGRRQSIGKRRWEFDYINMTAADWAAHKDLLEARQPFRDMELCRLDEAGRKLWINVSGEPVFDASGTFKGYRGVGKDITARKRAEELRSLEHAVSRSLANADNASRALQAAIRTICKVEDWECGRYFSWDGSAGLLRFADAWGLPDAAVQKFIAGSRELFYSPGTGLVGKVWESKEPIWVTDVTRDSRVAQSALAADTGIRGAFTYPVISQRSTIGVLAFSTRKSREPDEQLIQTIGVVGSQIGQFLERKQSEEELRRFRAAMDVSADMIWLIDPVRMKIIDANDTASRKLGYRREELLEMGPQDIINIPREELARIYRGLIAAGEGDTTAEGWYHRKDGSRFPVDAFRRAVRSEGGDVIVAVVRDLTEQRAAEEELRRFRLAMDNSADMIVLIDRATMQFVDVNDTACRLLGYSREELMQMGPQDILPVSREELERSYDTLIAKPSGKTGPLESGMKSHYRLKDGSLLPFESTRRVLRSGDTHIIAAISRDIRERLAAEERVTHLAQFDMLTGLPNRHLFQDRLAQGMALARRHGKPMAVLFIDLDRFKLVNDTQGHGAGDKLLKEAAERLRACIRESDTVGRLGGDEFAAILLELGKPGDAAVVAQKFIDALARPFDLDGRQAFVSGSIGITLFPTDGTTAEALIMNADAAMYRAKEDGRNAYRFFTRDMNERALRRVQMETALRAALERGEFRLVYQPKADLATGKICGFEALLRWEHPEKGMVLPGEFIPVLEETGLIVAAGEWVLRTACAQIRAWQVAGLDVPPVAVNLSARQFEQKNLTSSVRDILQGADIDPDMIQLEMTESLLVSDPEAAARTLQELKKSGVKLSLDDFGTGYSSLGYLKRFPIDTIKIDRSFIRDITTDADDATLTVAIIGLAHNLRLRVVAEGVETEAQLDFLAANGCDEIQGYYFARPAGIEECAQMLRDGKSLPVRRLREIGKEARGKGAPPRRARA
jgi:diguanylate cyclase (GGDEF)-like protein/PAS domain S-box-containing protein